MRFGRASALGSWLARHTLGSFSATPPPMPRPQIELVKQIQAASRKLCHRQMTWFRDEEMFRRA